jgi:hypothetical protein
MSVSRAEMEDLAVRLVWWKPPEESLRDETRLLAQVMVYGTAEEVVLARRCFPEGAFRAVLANPPPGVFDPRSWAYWHLVLRVPLPPELPRRRLPELAP